MSEPTLYDLFRDLSKQISDNHAEMVDRLARVETATAGLPERVTKLEGWQARALGAMSVLSIALAFVIDWLKRHI